MLRSAELVVLAVHVIYVALEISIITARAAYYVVLALVRNVYFLLPRNQILYNFPNLFFPAIRDLYVLKRSFDPPVQNLVKYFLVIIHVLPRVFFMFILDLNCIHRLP